MPNLKMGSRDVSDVYLGATPVSAIYKGSTLLWSRSTPSVRTFTRTQLTTATRLGSNSRCVFVSPEGNIFATDWSARQVKIFDNTGTYVRAFQPLNKIPYAITGDSTYIYIFYWDSTNAYKYRYSGTDTPALVDTWTVPVTQTDCAIIYNGYIYAASQQKKLYTINTSNGTSNILISASYPINAVGIDTKNNRIVTVQNGGMYSGAASDIIAKIKVYDMSGVELTSKNMDGTYVSNMNGPQGMVVDGNGDIYLGGSYSTSGNYNQGLLILNDSLDIIYDISYTECPTFCYSFCYDSIRNRIVWVASDYGVGSGYIFSIAL